MDQSIVVVVGSWAQLGRSAQAIRHQVFVEEQNVPIELELDEHDAGAAHAVALKGEVAVGTGRLLPDAHIGRMAVLKSHRGTGVGAMLLSALVDEAGRRGCSSVVLAAQCHAQGFYLAQGFAPEGAEFMDAGILHIQMRKKLC
ncbi:GNAT family N-acetyltransferase [Pusillimonas sp.]|uniref:GNAT family N-acetyltransferase n=1 Tax=Pusillimonas sp. TaxID=3040095 RepID=UPI0037C68984